MAKQKPRETGNSKTSYDGKYKKGSKSSRKPNNRREETRDYQRVDDRKTDDHGVTDRPYSNDPRWYKRAGLLAENTSNISTYLPIGVLMPDTVLGDWTPAGVARYNYMPCFGDFNSPTDSINYVGRLMYNVINSKNSRSDRYDPSDLMTYVLGVANAWALHSSVLRIIGMYNTYSVLNRYWWDDVLATMGVAPIDATNDIMKWVTVANKMALTLNTLPVPKDIAYFQRAIMMPSSVYVDSPIEKSSLYYFMPDMLLKFQYDAEGKGMLVAVDTPFRSKGISNRNVTPERIEGFFNSLVSSLINDSDIRYMGADIYKAYDGNLFTLPQIDDQFKQGFIFDPWVNLQLRNATVHDYLHITGGAYQITQNMNLNCLVSTNIGSFAHSMDSSPSALHFIHGTKDQIFDFPGMEVSNDMVIEATKLHAAWIEGSKFCATAEVLLSDEITSYQSVDGVPTLTTYKHCSVVGFPRTITSQDTFTAAFKRLEAATKIAAAPLQYVVTANAGTESEPIYNPPYQWILNDDLTNYTPITTKMLYQQSIAATTSLFAPFDLK